MCGHYTQIVWKNTRRIGCARVICDNGDVFMTCNYDLRRSEHYGSLLLYLSVEISILSHRVCCKSNGTWNGG
ncbi:hypothetical protein CRYUN_Cryun11dG0043900 [Craigia yunnanensis]